MAQHGHVTDFAPRTMVPAALDNQPSNRLFHQKSDFLPLTPLQNARGATLLEHNTEERHHATRDAMTRQFTIKCDESGTFLEKLLTLAGQGCAEINLASPQFT